MYNIHWLPYNGDFSNQIEIKLQVHNSPLHLGTLKAVLLSHSCLDSILPPTIKKKKITKKKTNEQKMY